MSVVSSKSGVAAREKTWDGHSCPSVIYEESRTRVPVLQTFFNRLVAWDRAARLFQRRVGPARFERRPTIGNRREILVGRRGEAPLVPPYRLRRPNKAMVL